MSDEYGGFGKNDAASEATITMINENTNFPKEWCVNGLPNEPTIASTTNCKIRFEFESAKNIKMVALIGHNMQDGDTIKLNIYSTGGWGTPSATVNLEPRWYERKIWKLGENRVSEFERSNIFSTLNQTQKYYEIELSGSSNPIVGEVCLFEDSFQFNRNYKWGFSRIFSPNKVTARVNKTFISKQSTESEDYQLSFQYVSDSDYNSLIDAFRSKGKNILFIPDYSAYECHYGMVSGNQFNFRREKEGNAFNLNFEESAA